MLSERIPRCLLRGWRANFKMIKIVHASRGLPNLRVGPCPADEAGQQGSSIQLKRLITPTDNLA